MKALIVDDDRVLADVVAFALRRDGFDVIQAFDGPSALAIWAEEKPDLLILDVNLPKMDGFTVVQRIRREADTPIIMLTVRSENGDVVRGLEMGADDYITKPFSPGQLVARARAVLRRTGVPAVPAPRRVGSMELASSRREVLLGRQNTVLLTPLEGRLLDCLMVNVGQILTYDVIIDNVWGPRGGDRDMLRQLVRRLRSKIETDSSKAVYIKTVPGLGYGLVFEERGF